MSDTRRRTVLKTVGGVTVVGTLAGCLSDDPEQEVEPSGNSDDDDDDDTDETDDTDDPEADSSLRVAHLSPDAPNVDVYVDGDAVLEDVPFRTVSDYLDLPAGSYDVKITAAGDPDTVVFDETLELPAGAFTAAALGELADENQPFDVGVFEDDLSDPGSDARIKLVHASPDAPNVDVTVGGDPLFEDVPFGAAGTVEVPAGDYKLQVRPATEDNDGDVVDTFKFSAEAGTVYTGFAVGYLAPGEAPADVPFDLEVSVDASYGEDEEDTALRVAHLSPDAPNVDVYVDGDPVLEDVPFRTVSGYLDLTVGTYDIKITAAGDPDTVVFDEAVELSAGAFTAAALGELADENQPFGVELYEDDRSDPGSDARVTLVHASPDAPNVDVTVGGDPLFEDVPFGAAGTVEVPAGDYKLQVRPATEDNDGDVVDTFKFPAEAGTVYTAFAVGYLAPDDAPADVPFDLDVAVDAD
jgi:predicted RNA-binding protein